MNRRETVLALLALGAVPLSSFAQPQGKVWRVGFLYTRFRPSPSNPDVYLDAFANGMRELGYVEGKNLVMEWRFADGHIERLAGLAAELARMQVDVIVTHSILTTKAAQQATGTIPIVIAAITDPVLAGLVKSLAHPGGNVTGLSLMSVDVSPKYVELLTSIKPKLSRIAVLINPTAVTHHTILKSVQAAAQSIAVTVLPVEARNAAEIERAIAEMTSWRAQAMIIPTDPIFILQQRQIVQLALKAQIPTIFASRQATEAGGLMSYGPNIVSSYVRAPVYVDKILKGAQPSELPIEQLSSLELVINKKTAKALGLTIPPELLLRADEVIE